VFIGVMKSAIDKQLSQDYGLCGGMAYAALDYYNANLVLRQISNDEYRVQESPKLSEINSSIEF
jgi:hypothetical protein